MSAFIPQVHIFADGHFRNQRKFLVNNNDTQFLGILYIVKLTDFTVVNDITFVCAIRINAAQHIHQGGFSGTVLADQCMDLALFNLEVDVVQCLDAWKSLCDVFHFQQNLGHGSPPALFRMIVYP